MRLSKYLIFLGIFMPFFILGQTNSNLIPLEQDTYDYFNYQITKGEQIPRFVLNQPYRLKQIIFNSKSRPGRYFASYWQKLFHFREVNVIFKGRERLKYDKTFLNRYRIDGGLTFTNHYITLVNQIAVDQNYKYDPKFAGDLSEADHWLYGRVNEAYVDFHLDKFNLFYGRTKRNWGLLSDYGLILSNNPYSYDHLLMSLILKRIKFSLIYAQLDEYNPVYSFKQPTIPIDNVRRNLAGHRLDIYLHKKLQIAFTEMATYGGKNRSFEWAFINPMNFYYPIQRNDQKQMDGFWCAEVFFKPFSKTTFWGQFLIDDIIVNNDSGVNDRGRYPDRLGVLLSARQADLLLSGTLWSLTYARIWNRTYQSKFSWENYHYRGYGLGYPSSGLEEAKFKLDTWYFFPFYLSTELIYGRYGNVSITDLFPLKKEPFPLPPVTYNLVNHLKLKYFASTDFQVFVDLWYRRHPQHYSNRFSERANWVLKVGLQFLADFTFGIE